jgi:Stress responsive A/B Barrel Domain
MQLQNIFIHHVFFWLKNADSREDLNDLVNGLKKLSAAKTIRQFHIGVPASTNRAVIDSSYSVSWCLIFDNKDDEESYQVDPIHLNFVKECAHLWNKVVVYDSIDHK